MSEKTRSVLQQYWGYPSFRPLQEEIVDAVVSGRDTLALLPTGGGKSICFQVPAMAMEGICIVITPLIALMKDQVAHLVEKNIPAAAIFSGMHPDEMDLAYNQAVFGRLKFLYVSPERLMTDQFTKALSRMKVNLLAVDESHCISQWGYDFRPSYLKIAEIRPYIPNTPVLALTATATAKVVDDIQFRLGFKQRNVFQSSFERKNVTYSVCHEADKLGLLQRRLQRMTSGSAIVYVRSRKRTQVISEWLSSIGIPSTFYHAGLDAKVRDERQEHWMKGKIRVMVATNAFGMGIDKPDVRLVVHIDLPDSIEAYFQEAGRAGRDLKPADALLLVSSEDIVRLKDNLSASFPELERIKMIYNAIGNYLQIPLGSGSGVSYPFILSDFVRQYGFSMLEVFNTLKILEKEGYWIRSESFEEPSKLFIKATREDLYWFQIEHSKYAPLINVLLRNLSGVLTDFVKIDEESLSRKVGIGADRVAAQLKDLERLNFLSYAPRNDKPQLLLLSEYIDTKYFSLSSENYYDRKKEAEERMQAVIGFVNNDEECRSVLLLHYFNEKDSHRCGRCDVCLKKHPETSEGKTYRQIGDKIINELMEQAMTVYGATTLCSESREDDVLDALRWMIDNDMVHEDGQGNISMRGKGKKV